MVSGPGLISAIASISTINVSSSSGLRSSTMNTMRHMRVEPGLNTRSGPREKSAPPEEMKNCERRVLR